MTGRCSPSHVSAAGVRERRRSLSGRPVFEISVTAALLARDLSQTSFWPLRFFTDIVSFCTGDQASAARSKERSRKLGRKLGCRTTLFNFHGDSYIAYHNAALPDGGDYRRSVCLDRIYFNGDGAIQPVVQTSR